MKNKIILGFMLLQSLLFANSIQVIDITSVINPASAKFIISSIHSAEDTQAEVLIIRLDTPGGLMTSMREIIKSILGSSVPVVVFVAPSGAQAASAGVFITVSSHIAAMAPGTNIGAAHPVSVGGGLFGGNKEGRDSTAVMMEKVTNDAVAYIQSIAEEKGRNTEWVKDAVIHSVSITEKEALELGVIEIIAHDLYSLIDSLDNREVKVGQNLITMETKNKPVEIREMSWNIKLLDILSHPNVSYILMMLGFYGLFFELSNPGHILPGVMGAFFLILAFYAFQVLPVNYAGVALIILGIILFILEIKVVSFGMLTVGGIIAMLIGSIMLFDTVDPIMRVSWSVIIPTVAFALAFFGIALRLVIKAMKNKPATGFEGLIGEVGEAGSDINENGGTIFINGEIWKAYSDSPIPRFSKIIVLSIEHLTLKVEKK